MFITVTGNINGSLEPVRMNVNHITMYYPCEGDLDTRSEIRATFQKVQCTQTVMEIRTAIENVQALQHNALRRPDRNWYRTKGVRSDEPS